MGGIRDRTQVVVVNVQSRDYVPGRRIRSLELVRQSTDSECKINDRMAGILTVKIELGSRQGGRTYCVL